MIQAGRSRGYTLVEVLLVLGIAGLIFASAMVFFSGQTNDTTFTQSMQDLNSEITAKLKEVGTNLSAAYQKYACQVSGNPPRATLASSGPSNNDCIYLGKAIFAPNGASNVYFYTVLGNRLTYQNGAAAGTTTNFSDTNPVAAISPINLTQSYPIRAASVTDTQITTNNATLRGNYYLVGYYTDLRGGSDIGTDSNPHLLAEAYNIGQPGSGSYDGAVQNCLTQSGSCNAAPLAINKWAVCFSASGSSANAKLEVFNSAAGTTTNLQFNVSCP